MREAALKKLVFLIALGISFAGLIPPLMAQEIPQDMQSEFYYVSVPLEKVYAYHKGYVIQYRKGVNQMATAYIPIEWFSGTDGKADLIKISSGSYWPHLTVYYKAGELSHIRLYVRRETGHETWGIIPSGVNIDNRFENADNLKLEF
jgi:hypothetical protein